MKNKYVIPISEIREIKKKKTLGIFNNSIEIRVNEDPKKKISSYSFTSFANRDIAYKRIQMVCKAYFKLHSVRRSKDNLNGNTNITSNTNVNSNEPITQPNFSDSNDSEGEQESIAGFNRSENLSNYNVSEDTEIENSNKEEVYFPPIDPSKNYEYLKIVVKIPPSQLYEKFLKDNAELSWDKFYDEFIGTTNMTLTEWKEIEPNTFVRNFNFVIKVKDVPFLSQTRVNKAQKLIKEGDKITYTGSSTSLDVPYSSYFHVEDTWEIIPYDGDKSVIR
jgi:hypothetical protein